MPSPPLSIVQSLSPRVAVLASDDVADSCEANGCRGLDELLRPWEGGTERVSIMSSTLTPTVHPTFPLRFVSYSSVYSNPHYASPNPDVVVDLIGSYVGSKKPEDEQHYALTRALLLSSRPLAPHETFNHPVAVLFAVSTSTPDPLGTLTRLYGQAVGTGAQAAPWMDGVQILKFFVVVHDVAKMGPALESANELLANVKRAYGPHSTLLVINSRIVDDAAPPLSPDTTSHAALPQPKLPVGREDPSALSQVYASALSSLTLSPASAAVLDADAIRTARKRRYAARLGPDDVQRLVALVRELVVQSLLPWMEARVREWNEVFQSNRRGITGRLFGAGRKLFGASRPTSPSPTGSPAGYNAVKGYYPVNAIEALSRRLADFAFMLRDYRFASNVYDSLRRDFAQDRAWRYAAAATEMYGLSQLLSHVYFLPTLPPSPIPSPFTTLQHTDILSWLEQAVLAYQGRAPANQIQLDALRVTVLYYEAWKAIGEWRSVAAALVRAAGEADEIPSAVMIEEAAAADVKGGKSKRGRRKQAFHLVMAARRYETAGLKTYSRRCLDRAAHLMRDASWTAARDRIEYSLGRQAYTLGESDVAVEHFLRLLQREDTGAPGSQGMVLEDMALAYERLVAHPAQLEAARDKLKLPTPVFDVARTKIVLAAEPSASSSSSSSSSSASTWAALEACVIGQWDRKGKKPMVGGLLPDAQRIVAAVGETIYVELIATNPLNAPLVLSQLTLGIHGGDESCAVETIDETALEPYETRKIVVGITPVTPGTFSVSSVSFLFHRFLPCTESLERRGRRLHATKAQRLTPTYAKDTLLTVTAEESRPRLTLALVGLPETLYEGEVVDAQIRLVNRGSLSVENVQLVTTQHGVLALSHTQHLHNPNPDPNRTAASIPNIILPQAPFDLYTSAPIGPGESVNVAVTLIVPRLVTGSLFDLTGLAVFSATDTPDVVGAARLVHSAKVKPSLSIATAITPAKRGYYVSVDATNHIDTAVSITGIHTLSQYWSDVDTLEVGPGEVVFPSQCLRSVIAVTPRSTNDLNLDLDQTALVANLGRLLHGHGHADTLAPIEPATVSLTLPFSSTAASARAYLTSRRAHRIGFTTDFFPAIPADVVPRVFPLFDPLDLDVGIEWTLSGGEGESTRRRGYSYVHGLYPAPRFSLVDELRRQAGLAADGPQKRTMYEETGRIRRELAESVLEGVYAIDEDPVVVHARVPSAKGGRVEHNFDSGSLALPVEIEVENRSPGMRARWIIRLPHGQATVTNTTLSLAMSTTSIPALFTGTLSHRGVLSPGERVVVHAMAWVGEQGMVSVSGWEVEVETGAEGEGEGEGEEGEDRWLPRASWSRVVGGGVVVLV